MHEQYAAALQSCSFDLAREQALFALVSNIRQSLDLDTILQTTIQELRQLLDVDRVGIVHLNAHQGWNEGILIAEAVSPPFDAALSKRVRDHCFGNTYASAYRDGRIQVINDVYEADLSPCHLEILSQFQVRANLLVPLLQSQELWGLLCIHQCSGPRHWQPTDIEFVSKIATHLSVAIEHAELLTTTHRQAAELKETLQALKSTQVQLAQSEKMTGLGQMAAGVAHEINNPVNFISGNLTHVERYVKDLVTLVHLYQASYPTPTASIETAADAFDADFLLEDLPRLFESMKTGAGRIRQIVDTLRNFSRLDEVGLKQVDLREGLDGALLMLADRLQPTRDRPQIQIQKSYGSLPLVECYPGQINQVAMSLLSNAIDAIDEAWGPKAKTNRETVTPLLSIGIQAFSDSVLITISDNGMGIPAAIQSRLYDPFFTTKPIGQGTGLGLAVSYQMIANHQGLLQCCSEPGEGTEFSIKLPLKQTAAIKQAVNQSQAV